MSAHLKAQLLRFARLTAAALFGEYLRVGGNLPMKWTTLWVLLPGTAETLVRQFKRVSADSASPSAPPTGG